MLPCVVTCAFLSSILRSVIGMMGVDAKVDCRSWLGMQHLAFVSCVLLHTYCYIRPLCSSTDRTLTVP